VEVCKGVAHILTAKMATHNQALDIDVCHAVLALVSSMFLPVSPSASPASTYPALLCSLEWVIDARQQGNTLRFANHSTSANCRAE